MHRLVERTDKGQVFRAIVDQVSEQRGGHPRSIALTSGDQSLSYEKLDIAAVRFAQYLAQLGVRPGGTVAICMERSFDWIVAALGIMRVGAAYIPLDPAWPDSRLRFAVEDSGATVLVARTALLDRLQVEARGIDPFRDGAVIAAATGVAREPIQPDSLAYVVYTSGSTGVPKGVEITHANLAHLCRWHRDAFKVTRRDRASHLAGLGFDAAVWEIWPHLSAGATVCLADDAVRSSPDLIKQWMIRERVTIGFVPTVHAAPMMAMEWPATTPLRLLLTGGDALHHAPVEQLPFDVVNNYGPTECTVVATSSVLKPGLHGAPPIGRPIAGTTIYLLNEDREQVPDGSIGEIYIGGSGVGRGYRNLPDLTERSFLPDAFSGAPHGRMYRTGDRGVLRPDGEIEFRGRLDRQTKICGQRVELDEIGSILNCHPSIDFATAITSISQKGEKYLVAYILPKEDAPVPTTFELQKLLLRSLPDYMIPAIFAQLSVLPLSANGKIDLTMLPQLSDAHLLEGAAVKAPATAVEKKLLTMVHNLLENHKIEVQDSFFLAGGHSLLGMQLVMRVRNEFGVNLTLRQLFETSTVARLASLVETMVVEAVEPVGLAEAETPIELGQRIPAAKRFQTSIGRPQADITQNGPNGKRMLPPGVLPLQPYGTRNSIFWIHYLGLELAEVVGDNQPFLSVVLTSEDFASLGRNATLQAIAACLVPKILAVQSNGPYTLGGLCLGGILAYEIASQLRHAGHEVALLVVVEAPNPTCIPLCISWRLKISYIVYALKRTARLGLWTSSVYLWEYLLKRFSYPVPMTSLYRERDLEIAKSAALAYRPEKYDGRVLLILASERPPHENFLPGWQAVVPRNLHMQYVAAHTRDLLKGKNVRSVVDAIFSHLTCIGDEMPSSCCANASARDEKQGKTERASSATIVKESTKTP